MGAAARHRERVIAGDQIENRIRAVVPGIGTREAAAWHFRAARASQRPTQVAVIGDAVEIELARIGQREGVEILLSGLGDRAVRLRVQGERGGGIAHRLDVEAVADRGGVADAAFDQQRVRSGSDELNATLLVTVPCGPVRLQFSEPLFVSESNRTCFSIGSVNVYRSTWPGSEILP